MFATALLVMTAALPDYAAFNPDDVVIHGHYTSELHKCERAPDNGNAFRQTQCWAEEDQQQDRQINAIWSQVLHRLDEKQRRELRGLQRQWIRDRKVKCNKVASDYTNTAYDLAWTRTYADETIRRTIWLEKLGFRNGRNVNHRLAWFDLRHPPSPERRPSIRASDYRMPCGSSAQPSGYRAIILSQRRDIYRLPNQSMTRCYLGWQGSRQS